MGSKRKVSPSTDSGTSSDSAASSSSGSSASSSSSDTRSPAARRERQPQKVSAGKRPRSPSPQVQQDKDRGHAEGHSNRHDRLDAHVRSHRQSPSYRRGSPLKDTDRGRQHSDVRQSSKPNSRREPDTQRSRHRENDHRRDAEQEKARAHGSRDASHSRRHDDRHRQDEREAVRARADRSQPSEQDTVTDAHRSSRHKSSNLQDERMPDASRSSRRPSRPDNPGSAKDQTGLPPPPSQPLPGPPEGSARRQGGAANGGQRQNRWAKEDTKGNEQWGKPDEGDGNKGKGKEEKPEPEANFALSGKLAAESNTVNGVVLVHQEPPESRKPAQMWRLYGFKNSEPIDKPLYIHRQSCYLFGRERRVADVPLDHPSISKQHAILQYRLTEKEGADNMMHSAVRPYLMDLGSANGTYLNNERIEAERYYELLERDMIKFGHSTREYVLLHAQSNAGA